MRCLSDEQIARLADAASDFEGRAAVEAHVDACAACRERLRVARHAATTFATALSPGPVGTAGTAGAGGTNDGLGILYNDQLVIQEGTLAASPPFEAGTSLIRSLAGGYAIGPSGRYVMVRGPRRAPVAPV